MSVISQDKVSETAHMARLGLSEQELNEITNDMTNILNLFEKINVVDTKDIKPIAHPLKLAQPLRDDTVTETIERDLYQVIAPDAREGFYIVPQVIEDAES